MSATVACTSTPANSVSSGVATTSRVPSAVVPTKTILSRRASRGTVPLSTSAAETVRERTLLAAESQQQVAPGIDRYLPLVDGQFGRVDVRHTKVDLFRADVAHHGAQRQARIDMSVELDDQRYASEDAVRVGRGVQESGGTSRRGEHRQTAHAPSGAEEWRIVGFVARVENGKRDGVQYACAMAVPSGIEGESITQNDVSGAKRVGQRLVRRRAGRASARIPIGFRKDHVHRDRRGAEIAQSSNQARHEIAWPRPLAEHRQAALVEIDDDDAAAGWVSASRSQDGVVHRVIETGEEGGPVERENGDDENRNDAAEKNQSAARCAGV